jgi:hypothetical protein
MFVPASLVIHDGRPTQRQEDHGFPSTFRDWAAECTNFPNEVPEAALMLSVTRWRPPIVAVIYSRSAAS